MMRRIVRNTCFLWFLLLLSSACMQAQTSRVQGGVDYLYLHTNAPPSQCGCINMNGGDAWMSVRLTKHWSAVASFFATRAANIAPANADLTLYNYAVGARYDFFTRRRTHPFAEAQFGGAHTDGTLSPGTNGLPGSKNAWTLSVGGGLDTRLNRHISLRLVRVDYFLSHFDNGVNHRQNNIRVGAGIIWRM